MLGSVAEAEDVVQEAFLRLSRDRNREIDAPKAYLADRHDQAGARRAALGALTAQLHRRGEWLPEPVLTEPGYDPASRAELADAAVAGIPCGAGDAVPPEQRAVLLLHDVFDYGYDEVARHRRQDRGQRPAARGASLAAVWRRAGLASRSRRSSATAWLRGSSPRPKRATSPRWRHCWPTTSFCTATGAARRRSWPWLLRGNNRVARTISASCLGQAKRLADATLRRAQLNGQPAALVLDRDGNLINVLVLEIEEQRIVAVNSIINPDKLRHRATGG